MCGIAQGVVGAVYDSLSHPVQTALCAVAGECVLAYQLSKVLCFVVEIGITSLCNLEQGRQKWNDFIEPATQIIDALYNKELSLRDVIQGVMHYAAHWKAKGKLLGGLRQFFVTTRAKAIAFAAQNHLSYPEQYSAMPDGCIFRISCKSIFSNNAGSLDKQLSDRLSSASINLGKVHKNKTTLWNIVDNNTGKIQYSFHGQVVNLYQEPSGKYWWSKDMTNHGGSYFKVFKKTSKGFEWIADADEYGNFIKNKHKSATGTFIKPK